jgi:hypothetical protein
LLEDENTGRTADAKGTEVTHLRGLKQRSKFKRLINVTRQQNKTLPHEQQCTLVLLGALFSSVQLKMEAVRSSERRCNPQDKHGQINLTKHIPLQPREMTHSSSYLVLDFLTDSSDCKCLHGSCLYETKKKKHLLLLQPPVPNKKPGPEPCNKVSTYVTATSIALKPSGNYTYHLL